MSPDATFRPVLVVGFLAVVSIILLHRLRSWGSDEKLDRRQEGRFILATLRPVSLMLWLGVIAYMIDPTWMAWSSVALPAWLRWVGVGLCAITAGLLAWTLHGLGTNLTDTVVTRRAHTMVTRGPYRWVRHPFYDCVALLIVAMSLIVANWFLLLTESVVMFLLVVRTRTEEEKLLARFGDSYRAYMQQTGRFLPRRSVKRHGA